MNGSLVRIVLVVDDEEIIEEYIQAVLHKHGYESRSFTDPVKALDFFREHPEEIDLIVTDVRMPAIDGLELAQNAAKIKPDIPIVFVSSDEGKLDEARSMSTTRACFMKPISRSELTACVENLIGRPPAS